MEIKSSWQIPEIFGDGLDGGVGGEGEESKMTPNLSNCWADGGMGSDIVKYLINCSYSQLPLE